jgi:RHS repeat-associated protein
MQYDIMGNILQKNQANTKNGQKQTATTYNLSYKYESPKPNAASEIGDRKFTYDENGNLTAWEDTATNDFRQLAWDEENRLKLISDNGYISNYVYDASGERVIKSSGGSQGVYINGAPAGIVNHSDNNYTVYVSPYFVVQNERFTKYYYAGSNRVTGKIGNGQFENQYLPGVYEITAGGVNYVNRQQQISNSRTTYEQQLETPPGPPTMKGIYAEPENTGSALPNGGPLDTIAPPGWPQKPVYAAAGGPPGAPVQWGKNITNDNVEAGFGYVGNGNVEENLRYFYHSDHLGSTSYITNAQGEITQFVAYLPFGEEFVEQHTDWDSPFKFNAKELDAETGLYYYGARSYDPKSSVWLGVDPMAEKYPFHSSYNYCLGNPIRFMDPNGEGAWTRVFGGLQMVGGVVEAVGGGVGGVVTSETVVGAIVGYAILLNGVDNASTGFTQMWTGERQNT